MNVLIVGYGRMGRAIEAAATARGHDVSGIVDPAALGVGIRRRLDEAAWHGADVAFEFTTPRTARANVARLLGAGVPVVCGTTGWADDVGVRRAARRAGAVIAPNYSVGMGLFYRLAAEAARLFAGGAAYDPWILEAHHRGKRDAPSGTARRLAGILAGAGREESAVIVGIPDGPVPSGAVHVSVVRAGHEPGRHVVGFDGEHDAITMEHRARGRSGFAFGAVLAAEWIRGRRGVHGFDEVLDDLLRPRRGRRGGGA